VLAAKLQQEGESLNETTNICLETITQGKTLRILKNTFSVFIGERQTLGTGLEFPGQVLYH
jgi:hypothetical protein